jgi:ribosomal protein S17E
MQRVIPKLAVGVYLFKRTSEIILKKQKEIFTKDFNISKRSFEKKA